MTCIECASASLGFFPHNEDHILRRGCPLGRLPSHSLLHEPPPQPHLQSQHPWANYSNGFGRIIVLGKYFSLAEKKRGKWMLFGIWEQEPAPCKHSILRCPWAPQTPGSKSLQYSFPHSQSPLCCPTHQLGLKWPIHITNGDAERCAEL